MTQAFIVRPFGNRKVLKKKPDSLDYVQEDFDFDRVEKELIRPAMADTTLIGGTTAEVFLAGDIREDMFSSLLLDDFVIADITIHNANVFYELGIRHALRDKRTILIKCPGYDETPFDILGYKYVTYDKDKPGDAVPDLARTIRETLGAADRTDSPVFKVLPQLTPQDPEKYLAVPPTFVNDLNIAAAAKDWGKISQLTADAAMFSWKGVAGRLIGEVLFNARSYAAAMPFWEDILHTKPLDRIANDRLSTIYQRLAEDILKTNPIEGETLFAKSDLAVSNLINNNELTGFEKAEAFSLSARNAKVRWIYCWNSLPAEEDRQSTALQSVDLDKALMRYEQGFRADLNHYYSGINVLGLLLIKTTLAEAHFETWKLIFPSEEDARTDLKKATDLFQQYSGAVKLSIQIARNQAAAANTTNLWANITEADYICLTATDPRQVNAFYLRALTGATDLARESAIRQLNIYDSLGVRKPYVAAAIASIRAAPVST
jgi:hypothetical protein